MTEKKADSAETNKAAEAKRRKAQRDKRIAETAPKDPLKVSQDIRHQHAIYVIHPTEPDKFIGKIVKLSNKGARGDHRGYLFVTPATREQVYGNEELPHVLPPIIRFGRPTVRFALITLHHARVDEEHQKTMREA